MVRTFHSDVRFRRIICRDARNWTKKLSAYWNGHNFWLGCMYEVHDIYRRSTMNNGGSREIQLVITFHSDVLFNRKIYKGKKYIKHSKLNTKMLGKFKRPQHLTRVYDWHPVISRPSKLNNITSEEIQIVLTFHSNVRFRRIIYLDARNWTRKLSANSNKHNFWLECMCEAHDISGHSTMNNRSSREIQMVITFHSEVVFRRIIYRDARNWKWKISANSNGDNLLLGCMCEAHDISGRSKMNHESYREIQTAINFYLDVLFRRIINWDTRNLTLKLSGNSNGDNFLLGCMCEAHDISSFSKMNNGSSREIQMLKTFDSDVRLRCIIYRDAPK